MEEPGYLRTFRCVECGHQDTTVWYDRWEEPEEYRCYPCEERHRLQEEE